MQELVARCRALLRRQRFSRLPQLAMFRSDPLSPECRVMVRGQEVNLSPKVSLAELFINHPAGVWSREHLLDQVWEQIFWEIANC